MSAAVEVPTQACLCIIYTFVCIMCIYCDLHGLIKGTAPAHVLPTRIVDSILCD